MNLQQFKAWFEGYTETMDKAPTQKQWARIKDRVGEITEAPTTVRYFYDHYWQGIAQNYASSSDATKGLASSGSNQCLQMFAALGKADFQAQAA